MMQPPFLSHFPALGVEDRGPGTRKVYHLVKGSADHHSDDPRIEIRLIPSEGAAEEPIWPEEIHRSVYCYRVGRRTKEFVHLPHNDGLHCPVFYAVIDDCVNRLDLHPRLSTKKLILQDRRPVISHLGLDLGWSYFSCVARLQGVGEEHEINEPFLAEFPAMSSRERTECEGLFPDTDFFVFAFGSFSSAPGLEDATVRLLRLRMLHSPELYRRFLRRYPQALHNLQRLQFFQLPRTELLLRPGVLADFPHARLMATQIDETTERLMRGAPRMRLKNLKGLLRLVDRVGQGPASREGVAINFRTLAPKEHGAMVGAAKHYFKHQALGDFFGAFWRGVVAPCCRVDEQHRPQVGLCFTAALSQESRAVLRGAVAREIRLDPTRDLLHMVAEDSANAKGISLRHKIHRLLRGPVGRGIGEFVSPEHVRPGESSFVDVLVMDAGGMTLDVSLNTLEFHRRPVTTDLEGTTVGHVIQTSKVYPYLGGDYLTAALRDLLPYQMLEHVLGNWDLILSHGDVPARPADARPKAEEADEVGDPGRDPLWDFEEEEEEIVELLLEEPGGETSREGPEAGETTDPSLEAMRSYFEIIRQLCERYRSVEPQLYDSAQRASKPERDAVRRLMRALFLPRHGDATRLDPRPEPKIEYLLDYCRLVLTGNPRVGRGGELFKWVHRVPVEDHFDLVRVAYEDCVWMAAQAQGELTFRPYHPPLRERHPAAFLRLALDELFRVQLESDGIDLLTPLAEGIKLRFELFQLLRPDRAVRYEEGLRARPQPGGTQGVVPELFARLRVAFRQLRMRSESNETDLTGHVVELGLGPGLIVRTALPPLVAAVSESMPRFATSSRELERSDNPALHMGTLQRQIRSWGESLEAGVRRRLVSALEDFRSRVPRSAKDLPGFRSIGAWPDRLVDFLGGNRTVLDQTPLDRFHATIDGATRDLEDPPESGSAARLLARLEEVWNGLDELYRDRPLTRTVPYGEAPFRADDHYQFWTYLAGQSSKFPVFQMAFRSVLQSKFPGVGLCGYRELQRLVFPVLSFNSYHDAVSGSLDRKLSAAEGALYEAVIRTTPDREVFIARSTQACRLPMAIRIRLEYADRSELLDVLEFGAEPLAAGGDLIWCGMRSVDLDRLALERVEVQIVRAEVRDWEKGEGRVARTGNLCRFLPTAYGTGPKLPRLHCVIRRRHGDALAPMFIEMYAEDLETGAILGGYLEAASERACRRELVGRASHVNEHNRFFEYSDSWAWLDWDESGRCGHDEVELDRRRPSTLRIDQLPGGDDFSTGIAFPPPGSV